jgi:hypothetical protein
MIDLIGIAYFVLVFALGCVGLAWVLGRVKGTAMRTNNGIAVPSESSPLPWHVERDMIYDVDRAWVSDCVTSTDAKFIAVAANYHERMADIVRLLAEWNEGCPQSPGISSVAQVASGLWAEYQKEVQP